MRPRNRVGGGLVTPDDRLEVLPVPPAATSRPMGWSDLRAEHFRDTPDFELDLPGGSHHLLALYLRPPEVTGLWTAGEGWEGTPPPGSILVLPAGQARRAFWRGPTESVHVHLDPRLISRVAAEALDLDPDRVKIPAHAALTAPAIEAAIRTIDAELSAGAPGGRLLVESLGNVFAVHLIRHATGSAPGGHQPRGGLPRG